MAEFGRGFRLDRLADNHPDWFDDLLLLWRPAGQAARTDGLRLAVRNGYLNFYHLGQSVARVCFGRGGAPRAEVHIKYVDDDHGDRQAYCTLVDDRVECPDGGILPYEGVATLKAWIARAKDYSGEEKAFVDRVVERNPFVIDLEMGLPAFAPPGQERVAPRMDLVALERTSTGSRLVFWEAKLMRDGRLRAQGDKPPKVVKQLADYRAWLEHGSHLDLVKQAYRNSCTILCDLHARARSIGADAGALDPLIGEAARQGIPHVDPAPRLLVEDEGRSSSWSPHAAKLGGIPVHYVRDDGDLTLPASA